MDYQRKKFEEVLKKTTEVRDFYENSIKELNSILDYMDKHVEILETDNVDTIILKKYIEYGSIKRVCEFINEKGYRIATNYSNRKYTTEDISQTIYPYKRNEDGEERIIDADEDLKEVVKSMHLYIFGSSYGKLRVKEFNKK